MRFYWMAIAAGTSFNPYDPSTQGTKKIGTLKQVKQLYWGANLVGLAPRLP